MKTIITKVKEFFAAINAKLVLAFFAGMLFLFLVGRGHGRHERFNHEKFAQRGNFQMNNDCKCDVKDFRFENRGNFRPQMRGFRGGNPEMGRGMRGGNPEMRGMRFNHEKCDSIVKSNMKGHDKFSYHIDRPINRIPIMLEEIIITAPKLSFANTNMIAEVVVFAQKLS